MKAGGKMKSGASLARALELPAETGLAHRGGLCVGEGPLFPPAGTFAALGGRAAVARLVDGLYDRIEADAVLRPAFNRDLAEERQNQKAFFEAWFGGSPVYFDEGWRHGLRVTHAKISISRGLAGRWLGHFLKSLGEAAQNSAVVESV